ncbi:MAG: alpha/beta hydrolase [Alphaproteobacteria bacterium]|nr:alpha/beta hydrolase [Alphaproteobacteria bacterium]
MSGTLEERTHAMQRWAHLDLCTGMRRFIAEVEAVYAGIDEAQPIAGQRRTYEEMAQRFTRRRPAGVRTRDTLIALGSPNPLRVRFYEPADLPEGPAPALIYFHGGGFALGSIESHDCVVAELALATSSVAISVDYRLAPEHPFPAAFDDAFGLWAHLSAHPASFGIDLTRTVLAGDSAGAALAVAVCLEARNKRLPMPAGQLLIYPALSAVGGLPSYSDNAIAPMLTTPGLAYFWRLYTGGGEAALDPRAAPLAASDFSRLPPAYIATARYDPCRDDGAVYADSLRNAGVPVEYRCANRLAHGYLRARSLSPAAAAEFAAMCEGARAMQRRAGDLLAPRDAA